MLSSVPEAAAGQAAKGADAVNTRTLTVDISSLVKAGENTVQIKSASTLYNRVLTRGYYNFLGEDLTWEPASYGITGDVQIVPYHTGA